MQQFLSLISTIFLAMSLMTQANGQALEASSELPSQSEKLFPKTSVLDSGTLTLYEPQIESHEDYQNITGFIAVSFMDNSQAETLGAIKFKASLVANFDERTATIFDKELLKTYFPEATELKKKEVIRALKETAIAQPSVLPLDVVLAYLRDQAESESLNISNVPPIIFYSEKPALLVSFSGEPLWVPVNEEKTLKAAANTNWDMFLKESTSTYYLLMGTSWLESKNESGPWRPAIDLPSEFASLPADERWKRARESVPGTPISDADLPIIYTSISPAELIALNGSPTLTAIAGTSLSFIDNTSNDIVYDQPSGKYYVLLSGRWFMASNLSGPWEFTSNLPESFVEIPEAHPRARVRTSIPGTVEAQFAVLQAQIPRTAAVKRTLQAPEIQYGGGSPIFELIDDTVVERAINSSYDVFLVNGSYYLCYQGVWFTGPEPTGVWTVTDDVPREIYTIPVNSPAHNVTYVKAYESTTDEVYFGYTSGYHNTYLSFGVMVYGSGYYWPPYYDPFYNPSFYGYYPYYNYYSYPYSYGHASFYNPVTGSYGHGHYAYGPYGGYREGERYNPRSGRYSTSQYAWDYDSGTYEGRSYNPRTDVEIRTRQEYDFDDHNEYDAWGETEIRRGDEWIRSERYANEDGSRLDFETSRGGSGTRLVQDGQRETVIETGTGDLYAGRNGKLYRQGEDGWQERSDGGWTSIKTSGEEQSVIDRAAPSVTPQQRQSIQERTTNLPTTLNRTTTFDRNVISGNGTRSKPRSSTNRQQYERLNRDAYSRSYGNQRYQRYQSYSGQRGSRSGGFNSRAGRRRR